MENTKATAAQIKEWETKYGTLRKIQLDQQVEVIKNEKTGKETETVIDEGKVGYLRKPDRATIKYAMAKTIRSSGEVDTISAGEVVLKKCWLGGDDAIMSDDLYYFRACIVSNEYLNEVTGFL